MATVEVPHWRLTETVIGAMIEVHRRLGPGLLESTYEACLAEELRHRGIPFARQVPIDLVYRETMIENAYQADLVVEGALLIELKAVDGLAPIHVAQTLTYMKLLSLEVALLANFNSIRLADGLRRLKRSGLSDPRDVEQGTRPIVLG
jgi:GxxExxY protein